MLCEATSPFSSPLILQLVSTPTDQVADAFAKQRLLPTTQHFNSMHTYSETQRDLTHPAIGVAFLQVIPRRQNGFKGFLCGAGPGHDRLDLAISLCP